MCKNHETHVVSPRPSPKRQAVVLQPTGGDTVRADVISLNCMLAYILNLFQILGRLSFPSQSQPLAALIHDSSIDAQSPRDALLFLHAVLMTVQEVPAIMRGSVATPPPRRTPWVSKNLPGRALVEKRSQVG